MNKNELQLQFLKLEQEGYNINSRCRLYSFGADDYLEFPAWKYKVIQFTDRHLKDHPYYSKLNDTLNLKRDRRNDFSDILTAMNVIGQDNEYWQEQEQSVTNATLHGSMVGQTSQIMNGYSRHQSVDTSNNYSQNSLQQNIGQPGISKNMKQRVFIVHGHDDAAKIEMARTIEKMGFEAIILHEQPNLGMTIMEKIAAYSDVAFAIILYTECDLGRDKNSNVEEEKYRARQNVVFEHGYLIGKLSREKVAAFVKGDVETPGDISGVVYTEMDSLGAWKQELARDMKAAGLDVDFNNLI